MALSLASWVEKPDVGSSDVLISIFDQTINATFQKLEVSPEY